MRVPFRKLRNLAKTTEALVVSASLTRQGHPPSRRLVLPEQLTASLALPEPAAAIDEGAWRAAETIEALEGLTFGEAIAPPASIECFDISHFCGLQTVGASSAFDRGVLAPDRYGWYALSDFVSAEGPFEAYLIFFRFSEVAGCFVAPRTLAGL